MSDATAKSEAGVTSAALDQTSAVKLRHPYQESDPEMRQDESEKDAVPLTSPDEASQVALASESAAATDEMVLGTAEAQTPKLLLDHAEPQVDADGTTRSHPTADQDDADFVPPDMEHIVTTGAAQDGASSMQALRELVAQARASSGQPREALPPGFGDDETDASTFAPTQSHRGEKRKAEDELEQLVQASAGIEEVKAAAEKSQHPETKTLLQKALSSISGLVSRRPKAESLAANLDSTPTNKDGDGPLVRSEAGTDDDSDSSSDSGSSSSDSSDDEEEDEPAQSGLAVAGDDDDDDEGGGISIAPATKNEVLAPEVEQPSIREVTAEEKQTLRKLGKVHSIVDSVVVVEQDVQQSNEGNPTSTNTGSVPIDSTGRQGERQGEYSVLDTGSLLCFEDGKVLGFVFETFGSIHNPMYSIRFASAASIDRDLVSAGKDVFYLPKQSTYVLTQLLRSMKGSDASNIWDEEVAEDEIDYSDDEQEAEAKRRAKAIRSGKVDDQGNPLPAPSARSNKRQKQQQGAIQNSQPPYRDSANVLANQAPGQQSSQSRSASNAPASLPTRNGGTGLPLPPIPAGSGSLAPAFPHGIASLPPRPAAGLPSKPTFSSETSKANNSNDTHSPAASRSRTGTAEGSSNGLTHSRMSSSSASGLPAKPVDAVAAAAAAAVAASSTTTYRAAAGVAGASSSPNASRRASMRVAPPVPSSAYPGQGSPGHYGGAGSVPSSMPASPAAPSRNASTHVPTYNSGAGAPVAAQGGGHYNPAYAAHWQHSYGAAATSAQHGNHTAGGSAWNRSQPYQAPPLHMAPGTMSQQPYGGYGNAHGGYGASPGPSSGNWSAQSYPGSHYPGYTDRQYHASATNAAGATSGAVGHGSRQQYASPYPSYNYGAYASQGASADPYNGYTYTPPSAQAATTTSAATPQAVQDSYDPRSPSMSASGNGQKQHATDPSQGL
ncbi:H/ACA ribonucleoprotein complex non-core subunit NAF1 [Pseudozyma hubeiensis]|nr:H/ACA ribonucleoprotein complex non-core subunit NAF1 [Pseudozyma hubeiensis]